MIGALASVIEATSPDEIDRILDEGIPDPVGSFYRFSLAGSLLRRRQVSNDQGPSDSEDALSTVD